MKAGVVMLTAHGPGRRLLLAWVSVTLLIASACGGVDDADGGERLFDYLGMSVLNSDPDEQKAFAMRKEQQIQELIAECMVAEGFEYIPAVPQDTSFSFGGFGGVNEEFARERGFGITTYIDDTGEQMRSSDWTNPNDAIVNALSESDREAYFDTLHAPPEIDPDAGEAGEGAEMVFGGGCMGQAYVEVFSFFEIFEQLDIESMYERTMADPRAQALEEEWSRCMSGKGYEYEDSDAMYESVYTDLLDRLSEIMGSAGGDPFGNLSLEEMEELAAGKSPEELADLYKQATAEALSEIDLEALADLQEEERGIALANFECSEDILEKRDAIAAEYEAEFINDNRAALEEFKDKSED